MCDGAIGALWSVSVPYQEGLYNATTNTRGGGGEGCSKWRLRSPLNGTLHQMTWAAVGFLVLTGDVSAAPRLSLTVAVPVLLACWGRCVVQAVAA
jgi:hypothetical protein